MRRPLLTIGIPTWNRCDDIKVAIDSVLNQLSLNALRDIEILVSDNASTDKTQSVLSEYQSKYPDVFSLHRNDVNLGFSRNVDMLFRKACGEFVLVLSDDDALEPGAIAEIMDVLQAYSDINIMFVLSAEYDSTLSRPLYPEAWAKARGCGDAITTATYYASGVEYYKANRSLCYVCISGNLYRASAWRSVDMTHGLASGSVQLHAAVQLNARGSSCLIRKPLIKYRVGANVDAYNRRMRSEGYKSGYPFEYHFDVVRACRDGRGLYPTKVYHEFYLICVRGVFYTLLDVKAKAFPMNHEYFKARLYDCFDSGFCGWLIPFFNVLQNMPSWAFVLPNRVYQVGQKWYFGLKRK